MKRPSAVERLKAECEERSGVYLSACVGETGSVITNDQCGCLVTPERFDEAAEAVRELEAADPALKGSIYLALWSQEGKFSLKRIGAVQ